MCDDNSTRQPLCNYYSSDLNSLRKEIDWCCRYFSHDQQQQARIQQTSPSILLLPHGAFCDSGPLVSQALHLYLPPSVDTVLLIGTEHASSSCHKISCSDHSQWRTPLGDVVVNDNLLSRIKTFIPADRTAFAEEHSVENQLPFLQTILGTQQQWSMVAISVHASVDENDLNHIAHVGQRLASLIKDTNVAVVATTDYTHAGPFYGELPVQMGQSIPDHIRARDLPFLNLLCGPELPSTELVYGRGQQISMCGLGSLLLTMELARNLGRHRARLINYAVGSDICERGVQDQTGFATVVFE